MTRKKIYISVYVCVAASYFLSTTAMFLISLWQGNHGIGVKLFGGGDDGIFYWEQVQNIIAGRPWVRYSIYPQIIGNIVKYSGIESPYLVRLFNYGGLLFLLAAAIKLVEFQVSSWKGDREGEWDTKILFLIALLCYPSLQIYASISILRDVWIYGLYTISLLLSLKLLFFPKHKVLNLLLLVPLLWLLGGFRSYALLSFLLSTGFCIAYKQFRYIRKIKILLFILFLVFGVIYTGYQTTPFPIVHKSVYDILGVRSHLMDVNSGGSQMWINLHQPNYLLFCVQYIHSYFGNFFGPLPWHIKSLSMGLLFMVETVPMILMLMFIWMKRKLLSQAQWLILIHAVVWIGLIALYNDNISTGTRLRVVAWIPILTVFVSLLGQVKGINLKVFCNLFQKLRVKFQN